MRGFVARDFVEHKDVRHMDRFIQYAVASARLALDQSGLRIGGAFAERVGVSVSSGIGGIGTIHHFARSLEGPGHGRLSPYFLPMVLINLAAGQIAIRCCCPTCPRGS